jgi:hypothetical protein
MEYINSSKNVVKTLDEWKEIFTKNPSKKDHWKEGRSAYELANFMLNKGGGIIIKNFLDKILNEEITFSKAYIELEVKFDKYNHGREHDLGIWGKTNNGKSIFIGIESKVDEPLNSTIKEVYIKNKAKELNGDKTNTPKRIENLLKRNFKTISEEQFEIRYQLIYSTVGTIDAIENKKTADISVFLIIVFKTKSYDVIKGAVNYNDFQYFIKEINAQKILKNKNQEMYKTTVDGKDLYIGYLIIE